MQDTVEEESTFQLVIDQVEELIATVLEEIQQRPGVALAICAGLFGAFLGARLATRMRRRRAVPAVRRVGDMAELVGLGVRLLQNPIVRGLLIASVQRQLRRPISG